jgi:hypothetical protein
MMIKILILFHIIAAEEAKENIQKAIYVVTNEYNGKFLLLFLSKI